MPRCQGTRSNSPFTLADRYCRLRPPVVGIVAKLECIASDDAAKSETLHSDVGEGFSNAMALTDRLNV